MYIKLNRSIFSLQSKVYANKTFNKRTYGFLSSSHFVNADVSDFFPYLFFFNKSLYFSVSTSSQTMHVLTILFQ